MAYGSTTKFARIQAAARHRQSLFREWVPR